jgi:plastocyanin
VAALAALAAALWMDGCRRDSGAAPPVRETGAAASATAGGIPADQAPPAPGAIAGRVLYRGPPPPPRTMEIPEAGELEAHTVIVDTATGGLKNAVVAIEAPAEAGSEVPSAALRRSPAIHEMDQRNYAFRPHVLALQAGDEVRFLNSDNANHNVHAREPANAFNLAGGAGVALTRRFRRPTAGRAVAVGCDIHPWMKAWIYVFDHPWFAVTDTAGRFRLDGVPPGRHVLGIYHADGALEARLEVVVKANETAEVEPVLEGK